jgi:hypothetical protein
MDAKLAALIMETVNNYTEPQYRKARKSDFTTTDDKYCEQPQSSDRVMDNRLQKEYGERKRIKP